MPPPVKPTTTTISHTPRVLAPLPEGLKLITAANERSLPTEGPVYNLTGKANTFMRSKTNVPPPILACTRQPAYQSMVALRTHGDNFCPLASLLTTLWLCDQHTPNYAFLVQALLTVAQVMLDLNDDHLFNITSSANAFESISGGPFFHSYSSGNYMNETGGYSFIYLRNSLQTFIRLFGYLASAKGDLSEIAKPLEAFELEPILFLLCAGMFKVPLAVTTIFQDSIRTNSSLAALPAPKHGKLNIHYRGHFNGAVPDSIAKQSAKGQLTPDVPLQLILQRLDQLRNPAFALEVLQSLSASAGTDDYPFRGLSVTSWVSHPSPPPIVVPSRGSSVVTLPQDDDAPPRAPRLMPPTPSATLPTSETHSSSPDSLYIPSTTSSEESHGSESLASETYSAISTSKFPTPVRDLLNKAEALSRSITANAPTAAHKDALTTSANTATVKFTNTSEGSSSLPPLVSTSNSTAAKGTAHSSPKAQANADAANTAQPNTKPPTGALNPANGKATKTPSRSKSVSANPAPTLASTLRSGRSLTNPNTPNKL